LYIDNYFTSIPLCEKLQEKGIEITETVRRNRKGLPAELAKKPIKEFERFEIYQRKKVNSKIRFVSWKNKRVVNMLSTVHSAKSLDQKKWYKKQKNSLNSRNRLLFTNTTCIIMVLIELTKFFPISCSNESFISGGGSSSFIYWKFLS